MGLDIFAHKVSKSVANKYNLSFDSESCDITDALTKEQAIEFNNTTNEMLGHLRKQYETQNEFEYKNSYLSFINSLKKNIPLYNLYDFKLKRFGYDIFNDTLEICKTPDEVETILKEDCQHIFAVEDLYFRKLNFIYAFFSPYLVNETCIVDKICIGQLKNACEDVLANEFDEDYAREVLPTQGGFFFGSTEYDSGYYEDVKYCLKEITKLYNSMDDSDFVLLIFSW